jgi:chromosome segregation ATPase
MSRAPVPKGTTKQQLQSLRLKTGFLETEIRSARQLNEQTKIDSGRQRARIRRMEGDVRAESANIDDEIQFLEWNLEVQGQKRAKLQAEVSAADESLQATMAKCAEQLAQKRQEQQEQEALLKSELRMYTTELESLREFQSQRAQMEEELRHLDQTLLQYRQVHQETMEQFRAQLKREQDHFERENARRVREAEQSAVMIKDECLEAAAVRCIQDAATVDTQLRRAQMKSRDILTANNELIQKIDSLKRENLLLTDREKMLIDGVAKHRQRIEAVKLRMSEEEISYTKERARIESESTGKIEALETEIQDMVKENEGLRQQIVFLKGRIDEIEGHQALGGKKQAQLMRLITSTAPVVLESLKSSGDEEQPAPLEALIAKLTEALEEEEKSSQNVTTERSLQSPKMATGFAQTTNPNMKFF